MKSGLLVFNAILLVLIGILFYLHFTGKKATTTQVAGVKNAGTTTTPATDKSFQIAYFDMDTLENSFSLIKDVRDEISRRERAVNAELSRLEKGYKDKLERYQGQAATMNQVQSEMATKDMM